MLDANQQWDVDEAIACVRDLAHVKPWWIEEPTSPDDVLGHATIAAAVRPLGVGVATGEHCANRVMFKQLLQAKAIDFCQIDSCRLGGVNENLAVMLMAAKFGVPVCPHAGGVGLCEYVQHLSMFDYIGIPARMDGRVIEYVDHLHEHFEDPVVIRRGRYVPPSRPGYSITIRESSRLAHRYPDGDVWGPDRERIGLASSREPLTYPRIASLKSAEAFRAHLERSGIPLAFDDRIAPHAESPLGSRSTCTASASATGSASCRWKAGTARGRRADDLTRRRWRTSASAAPS
jgi:hypothetical protein